MTGAICNIATCNSRHEKAKKDGKIVTLFTLPKIPLNYVNKRICSKDFDSEQFENLIHAKLTKTLPTKLKEIGKSLIILNLNYNS